MESSEADFTESLHYRKEKMTVTWRDKVPHRNPAKVTCSLGEASGLFNMSESAFFQKFVITNRIRWNRLHQFQMSDVIRLLKIVEKPNRFNQGYNR